MRKTWIEELNGEKKARLAGMMSEITARKILEEGRQ